MTPSRQWWAGAILVLLAALPLRAQPEFDAASIKPYVPQPRGPGQAIAGKSGGPGTSDPGRVVWTGNSLRNLILYAYERLPYQVSGPDWIATQRFDVMAKIPAGTTMEQYLKMWQNLLLQRFGLKFHHETREIPVYELTVARGGPKLKESAPPQPNQQRSDDGPPRLPPMDAGPDGCPAYIMQRGGVAMVPGTGQTHLCMSQHTLDGLCTFVSNQLSRPVINKTGLTAKYDLALEFEPETGPTTSVASDPAPTIFAAFQKVGLKLEARKSPVDILVVDAALKTPTEN